MLGAVCVAIGSAVVALYEVRNLKAERRTAVKRRNLVVFFVLLACSTGLLVAHLLHVRLPNPLAWIEAAVKLGGLQFKSQ